MPTHIEIDFISDVACPWCAIGLASLEAALLCSSDAVSATICFRPFELNPDMGRDGVNIDSFIGARYGADQGELDAMRANVRERAANVGFAFNQTSDSRIYNTFDAHRLLHWARNTGRQQALKHALFTANFTDNADVSSAPVLVAAAATAGLAAVEAQEVLASGRYAEKVRQEEQSWISRGIHAVPAAVINGKWLITGGQPPEAFEKALRDIAGVPAAGA